MVKTDYTKLLKNWRIIILIISVALALILILANGLDYGMDFAGGYEMQLELDWKGIEPTESDMEIEKSILEERLNAMGLKDVSIRPWGKEHIKIQIANATPSEIERIEGILKQQAQFEERIDGELAVYGDEISIELGVQGSRITPQGDGFKWEVVVKHDKDGACRFGEVATGKKGKSVDTFIDRPKNTVILISKDTYELLNSLTSLTLTDGGDVAHGDSAIQVIERRANISVVVVGVSRFKEDEKSESLNETAEDAEDETKNYTEDSAENYTKIKDTGAAYLAELERHKEKGIINIIVAGDPQEIPEEVRNKLEEDGFNTERMEREEHESYGDWITRMIGLENAPTLQFDPRGNCVYDAVISGPARDIPDAQDEIKRVQALLSSGNLPAKPSIGSRSLVPPSLGAEFLRYCLIAGLFAIMIVATVIFLRYKKIFIVIPIMVTCISEILLILGLASAINWQLDLAAVAGIIAAVGTGVDHQIVITDETLQRRKGAREKVVSVTEQIARAFFIIFTAAATTIAAMIPLLAIGAGMLKGFAFTTIIGVLLGVFIARPAFAATIEFLLKR